MSTNLSTVNINFNQQRYFITGVLKFLSFEFLTKFKVVLWSEHHFSFSFKFCKCFCLKMDCNFFRFNLEQKTVYLKCNILVNCLPLLTFKTE